MRRRMAKQFVVNPSRCKKFLPGHGTHWGPVLKTHPNTPRVRVLVYDLDEEGWFTISSRDWSERWWHHDIEVLERFGFERSGAMLVKGTGYILKHGQQPGLGNGVRWIHAAAEATTCL
jgi:hypothetical protein|tara:strand:+ start:239 stop:592 length:354 start_codon:yes stop_codon:yes gene_type:complete